MLPALKRLEGIKWFCLAPADTCMAESKSEILKQKLSEKGKC